MAVSRAALAITLAAATAGHAQAAMLLSDAWLDRITAGAFDPHAGAMPMTRSWLSFLAYASPLHSSVLPGAGQGWGIAANAGGTVSGGIAATVVVGPTLAVSTGSFAAQVAGLGY